MSLSLIYSCCTTPYCSFPWLLSCFLSLSLHAYCSLWWEQSCQQTHTHSHRCVHITPSHIQTHSEPWLSSTDNERQVWPIAASLCLTLSLCNPSSVPVLIYTCFSSQSSSRCSFLTVVFFVHTLVFANIFLSSSILHPLKFQFDLSS